MILLNTLLVIFNKSEISLLLTFTVTAYTDLGYSVGPGDEIRVYFGSATPGGTGEVKTGSVGIYESPILLFGICAQVKGPGSGTLYGQTIPFLGILLE